MQIDPASYKRSTQRIELLEELVEIQSENIAALIRAIKSICNRLPRPAGSSDPWTLVMMDPHTKQPYVLSPGLSEELDDAIQEWAIAQLSQAEADDFHRRSRIIWRMREMRAEREARKPRSSFIGVRKPSGGGSPEATPDV